MVRVFLLPAPVGLHLNSCVVEHHRGHRPDQGADDGQALGQPGQDDQWGQALGDHFVEAGEQDDDAPTR